MTIIIIIIILIIILIIITIIIIIIMTIIIMIIIIILIMQYNFYSRGLEIQKVLRQWMYSSILSFCQLVILKSTHQQHFICSRIWHTLYYRFINGFLYFFDSSSRTLSNFKFFGFISFQKSTVNKIKFFFSFLYCLI